MTCGRHGYCLHNSQSHESVRSFRLRNCDRATLKPMSRCSGEAKENQKSPQKKELGPRNVKIRDPRKSPKQWREKNILSLVVLQARQRPAKQAVFKGQMLICGPAASAFHPNFLRAIGFRGRLGMPLDHHQLGHSILARHLGFRDPALDRCCAISRPNLVEPTEALQTEL